jgi:hypothetical protein
VTDDNCERRVLKVRIHQGGVYFLACCESLARSTEHEHEHILISCACIGVCMYVCLLFRIQTYFNVF